VSKERARRRAEREATRAVAEAKRRRREQRHRARRALIRKLTPRRRRRGSMIGRRSAGQRAVVAGVGIVLAFLVWYLVPTWPVRIAFWLLIGLLLPVFALISFDRKGMKL